MFGVFIEVLITIMAGLDGERAIHDLHVLLCCGAVESACRCGCGQSCSEQDDQRDAAASIVWRSPVGKITESVL